MPRPVPDSAASDPASSGVAPDALESWLAAAPISEMGRIPWGSNAVFQVRLETPPGPRLAIYKPARGERPLWDFPARTLHRREVATARVDGELGWGLTPRAALRPEGPLGVGSMQEFIEPPQDPALVPRGPALEHALAGMAALDVLVNNADRKRAHLLVDPAGRLRGIDHGVTFHQEFKLRTVLLDLGGEPVPDPWLADLRRLAADGARRARLRQALATLLAPVEVEAFEERLRQLARAGTYPVLDPWYGRPFEW